MTTIKLSHNIREVEELLARTTQKAATAAVRRVLQRTATGLAAQGARGISTGRLIKLSIAELKQRFAIRGNTDRAGVSLRDLYVAVHIASRAESLRLFYPTAVKRTQGRRRVVKVEVRVFGNSDGYVTGGFLFDTRSRKRVDKLSNSTIILKRMGPGRLPLRKMHGPSISDIVRRTEILEGLERYAQERIAREIAGDLKRNLERAAAKLKRR